MKTNFYQPTKVALSFRLAPDFLPEVEYPTKPFGMFFIVGAEFRGFHIRFRDVARGGIRIVRARNKEAYSIAQRQLFDENYALAATQSLKNKDIPEGGAKGTILPGVNANPRTAFEKYVDAVIDLLIPGQSPGIKERIVDLYGKPELLFFGPDEGTADMMDWAACEFYVFFLLLLLLLLLLLFGGLMDLRVCSTCSRTWCGDLVEVIHYWKEC